MAKTIRVLVVDDSALLREMIADLINEADGMELVGKASDGNDALEQFTRLKPDLVSLDIEMPGMNGLDTLQELLKIKSVPVIMCSALTKHGADVTQQALEFGALDFVAKPDGIADYSGEFKEQFLAKIRNLAHSDVDRILEIRRKRQQTKTERMRPSGCDASDWNDACIAIGISTGGPPALTQLFESLAPTLPPIVIVQHMPKMFTGSLAERLNSLSSISVKEAAEGDFLEPNHAYLAPGGYHMRVKKSGPRYRIKIEDGPPVSSHKPSVDVMMKDVAGIFGSRCVGLIMTGMGRDGADGCGNIKAAGGYVLGQDEKTSDVYGMNKVAFEAGNVDRQFSLPDAAKLLTEQVRKIPKMATTA